jgi:hypothetical protein
LADIHTTTPSGWAMSDKTSRAARHCPLELPQIGRQADASIGNSFAGRCNDARWVEAGDFALPESAEARRSTATMCHRHVVPKIALGSSGTRFRPKPQSSEALGGERPIGGSSPRRPGELRSVRAIVTCPFIACQCFAKRHAHLGLDGRPRLSAEGKERLRENRDARMPFAAARIVKARLPAARSLPREKSLPRTKIATYF